MAPVQVSDIPTLTDLYTTHKLSPSSHTLPGVSSTYNHLISLIRTDITTLATGAIVNAANNSLLGGGGVDGAIHSAAGPDLKRECRTLDGCDTGDAKITGAYSLPCDKTIHAVGPVYHGTERDGRLLARCYTRSLDLAVENGCKSLAFSALSTGVYGYPSDEAAECAIGAVKGWLDADAARAGKLERIVFCSFLAKDERAYEEYIPQFFPPAKSDTADAVSNHGEETTATDPEGSEETPQLPDVPTNEPTEVGGQPAAKRQKLGDDDSEARI